jgi:hypothetical protein
MELNTFSTFRLNNNIMNKIVEFKNKICIKNIKNNLTLIYKYIIFMFI